MNDFDREDSAGENVARKAKEPKGRERVDEDNEEDDYSDDDFEQHIDAGQDIEDESKALQVIHENTNESRDQDYSIAQDVHDGDSDPYKYAGSAG